MAEKDLKGAPEWEKAVLSTTLGNVGNFEKSICSNVETTSAYDILTIDLKCNENFKIDSFVDFGMFKRSSEEHDICSGYSGGMLPDKRKECSFGGDHINN